MAQKYSSEPPGTPSEPRALHQKRLTAFSLAPKTVLLQACQKVRNPKNRATKRLLSVANKSSEPHAISSNRITASLSAPK